MKRKRALSRNTTPEEFDRGYWYALELKRFAQDIGVPSASSLRKNELEALIKEFLVNGWVSPLPGRHAPRAGVKDVERGLARALRIERYTNDKPTKEFLEREARIADPAFKKRSGAMYRLNRWRESQVNDGRNPTYGELVDEYVRLCRKTTRFDRFPHGRYVNFLSDFLAAEPGATHERAVRAWHELKAMDVPKNYEAWRATRSRGRK